MAAGVIDFNVNQGATFKRVLTFQDADENPIDLTSYSFAGSLRFRIGDRHPAAKFEFELLDQTTDTGKVEMTLTAEESANIPLRRQRELPRQIVQLTYDVERTNPDGTVDRVLQGKINLSPEVTKE